MSTRVLLAVAVLGPALLAPATPASAIDLAGTAWVFTGYADYDRSDKSDLHHALRGRGPGRLAGSSCCERFVVAFPTNDSFSLRHNVYVIATGSVQARRRGLVLVPDTASVGTLLWWLENVLESSWNAGVFSLDLNLWLTQPKRQSIAVRFKTAGGETRGTLDMGFQFRGEVRGFDRDRVRRFSTGPVSGKAHFREKSEAVMSLEELEEYDPGYPLPPVRPCDEEEFGALGLTRGWPGGPDYCRQ